MPFDSQRNTDTYPQHRPARALVMLPVIIVALVVGAWGGRWIWGTDASMLAADSADFPIEAVSAERWYTCGMHPDVLQQGPGDCPICHMKLTPRKESSDDSESNRVERKILYWRAPMDPNYTSPTPGKSPMGMDMVPVYADAEDSPSSHSIRIDPVTIQNMGLRSAVIQRGPLVKTIRTLGRVDYDEQKVTFVDTKFNGWIEGLHVDQTGQHVGQGQVLFDVYSPELYAAQEEFLAAARNQPLMEESSFALARDEAAKLVEAAETKLRYMDVSDEQIARLREGGPVAKTLTIHSPARGIVTEKMALEGMYVRPGMRLFTIADLSRVWVYVDIYEYQLPWIRTGQAATMTLPYIPGKSFLGTVVYIYPFLEEKTRVITVRLEFENPTGELKPGMFANVELASQLQRDAVLIPREAYIDSGKRKVAFVDQGHGKFAPRDIHIGVEAENGMAEVLYGLDEGEVVVTSGQFLLDAESKLQEASAKMMQSMRATTTRRLATSDSDPAAAANDYAHTGVPPDARYACPMDKHPDETEPANQGAYFSERMEECPLCRMNLVPLDDLEWVALRRAAEGSPIAYTCNVHAHVFAEEPGQCPLCGDALAPFKVLYNCPDPSHAGRVMKQPGNCSLCGRGLAAYRGQWLDEEPAVAAAKESSEPLTSSAYYCSTHRAVQSERAGNCTICAAPLKTETATTAAKEPQKLIPPDATHVCPMKICWHFAQQEGRCPECGMDIKPIEEIEWARDALARQSDPSRFTCPMHPKQVKSARRDECNICGMQLVESATFQQPQNDTQRINAQMDYVFEHYLELQKRLSADNTKDVARHALGLAAAAYELRRMLSNPSGNWDQAISAAAQKLHAAALRTSGADLFTDRIAFIDMSEATQTLLKHTRPDRTRWPKLFIYHCPMSKGDWIQSEEEKSNPYYGFKMLRCGELKEVR